MADSDESELERKIQRVFIDYGLLLYPNLWNVFRSYGPATAVFRYRENDYVMVVCGSTSSSPFSNIQLSMG